MTPDRLVLGLAAVGLAAIAVWWVWAINRDTNRRIDTLAATIRQHGGSIVQLQTTMANTPLQVHQPMPKVGRRLQPVPPRPVALPGTGALVTSTSYVSPADPDQTLRLGPPPSLARIGELCHTAGLNPPRESLARIAAIEQHLAGGRPTTRMELARALNLQPWEISADLHTAVLARIVTTTSSHHTAGEAAYTLPDPTIRMARMPLLPGAA